MNPQYNHTTDRFEDSEGRPRRPVLATAPPRRTLADVRRDLAWKGEHARKDPTDDLDRAAIRGADRAEAEAHVRAVREADAAQHTDVMRLAGDDAEAAAWSSGFFARHCELVAAQVLDCHNDGRKPVRWGKL